MRIHTLLFSLTALISPAAFATGTGDCPQGAVRFHLSPIAPLPGDLLHIKAVSVQTPVTRLELVNQDGTIKVLKSVVRGGPPFSLTTELSHKTGDLVTLRAYRDDQEIGCLRLDESGPLSETEGGWSAEMEAYYSSWVEQLFDASVDEELNFRSLEPVLRDPERNFLFNHLGSHEDERLPATPDCADLPYFLRSYFAWKTGLPISYRSCDRGSSQRPPRCGPAIFDDRFMRGRTGQSGFIQFSRKLNDTVHSGSARTALEDNATDFYPVALDRNSLWPGTVFADPYGHTLIIAKWVHPENGRPGLLLAADAQPDNSVTRKRFWEGNFLFADIQGAGPGFKAFRPVRVEDGHLVQPSNRELSATSTGVSFSDEQLHMNSDEFYAAMAKAINPGGLDPVTAYEDKLAALTEQVATRNIAIQNAERYFRQHPGSVISMPNGAAIFQTTGPWEDYASPSRDMRLLIALKTLEQLPDQIRNHPDLFRMHSSNTADAVHELQDLHHQKLAATRFQYTQTGGQMMTLPLSTLFARREALETGYNPNDCPEIRWGADPGSEELSACQRRAPAEQRQRMEQYRSWFRNTQRPAH